MGNRVMPYTTLQRFIIWGSMAPTPNFRGQHTFSHVQWSFRLYRTPDGHTSEIHGSRNPRTQKLQCHSSNCTTPNSKFKDKREREGGKKENINKQRQESTDRNNRLSPHLEHLQQRLTLNRMQSIGAESITDENRCKLLTPAQTTFENFGGSYSELPHTSQIYDADPFLLSAGALPWTNPKHPHLLSTGHKKATPQHPF